MEQAWLLGRVRRLLAVGGGGVGRRHPRVRRALDEAQADVGRRRGGHLQARPHRGRQQPQPRRPQDGGEGEREEGDAGEQAEEVRGAVRGDEPDRPVLAVPRRLGDGPEAAGAVRAGVRAEHHRRAGREDLRGDGRHGRRRGEPAAGDAPVGRDPEGAPVDHLREDDDHQAQGGAARRQRQDDRRARGAGAHHQRGAADGAAREQRHHPQHPHQRHRHGQGRHDPGLAGALRLPHPVRRRRRHRLRLHQRLARPPLPLQLPGRPHRRHRQVQRHHHLQLPPHQPQRRHALRLQRLLPRRPDHADHRRLQPLRQRPRPENAKMPVGILPRGEQRLHALAHVRHRRQQEPDDHQPGEPLHRAAQPRGEADHEAAGRVRVGVEELGVALAGRPLHGGRLLHRHRRRHQPEVQQEGPDQAQARVLRHEAHSLRRRHPLQDRQAVLIRGARPCTLLPNLLIASFL